MGRLTGILKLAMAGVLSVGANFSPLVAQPCRGVENELAAAASALRRGDVSDAERVLSSVQTSHPECAEALLGLGQAKSARKDHQAAYRLLVQYNELVPQDARGYVSLAELLLAMGKPGQADALSAKGLSVDPNSVPALVLRGRILGMKGDWSQATDLLAQACKLAPTNPEPYFELGVLHDRRQESAKAAEQFEKVVKLSPQNPRAYDYLALSLEPLGQYQRAEWAYKEGLKVNQGPLFDSFLDYNYGRFLVKLNRLEEAATHLDRAVQLAPATRATYYERAKLKEKQGNFEQARLDAEKALSLKDPGGVILDLQVYYLLARIYKQLGEEALAATYARLAETAKVPIKARMRGGR